MTRIKPTTQDYSVYTAEDFLVWKTLFERQLPFVKSHASKVYLEALQAIEFNADVIPNFVDTTKLLQKNTGWQMKVVPELVPQKDFFQLLTQKIFPATCWLRTAAELNYIEEPDMFHDVFGHIPLLVNEAYANFIRNFSKLAIKWIDNPNAIALIGRVYWYTVEFGLLRENGSSKIFGAGIISSIEETQNVISEQSVKKPFDVAELLDTEYRIDALQPQYFVMESFEQLCRAIEEIDDQLEKMFAKPDM